MSYYIKVNKKVRDFLSLPNRPTQLPDGNFLLWQADMLAFGPVYRLMETCASIGAVALTPAQAAQEQRGIITTTLPVATDPRFIMDEEPADVDPGSDEAADDDCTTDDDGDADITAEEGGGR